MMVFICVGVTSTGHRLMEYLCGQKRKLKNRITLEEWDKSKATSLVTIFMHI